MLLRSRILYPVASPPIDDGAVWIIGGRLRAVGPFAEMASLAGEHPIDLGECILMPGLVNAHCHLDYTGFAGLIAPPSGFTSWVKQLITLKAQWSYTEFAESWLSGMRQLVQSGTCTVGDIEAVPELLPDVLPFTPIRVHSFRELIAVRSRARARDLTSDAVGELDQLSRGHHQFGLSPHAPYTTSQDLVREVATQCRQRGWKWTMHVAESTEESEMFSHRRGVMHDWLKSQRDMNDCGNHSPFEWLENTGTLNADCLMVHANGLNPNEITRLALAGSPVVHCPRSHEYFRHSPFPAQAMKKAGVNLCLGTDSLASTESQRNHLPRLDMFSEMMVFRRSHPEFTDTEVVEMATVNGAKALGMEGETGTLRPGLSADLIAVPWNGSLAESASAIVHHSEGLKASMCFGRWNMAPL